MAPVLRRGVYEGFAGRPAPVRAIIRATLAQSATGKTERKR
jgi:hypothetical protein